MANKKDKSTKNKEEEKKTPTKQDGKILNNAYDTYVSGTTSKERIEEVMGKITITSCDAIVSPPSNYGGGGSGNASCGSEWNVEAACADASMPNGHAWTKEDGSLTISHTPICDGPNMGCKDCKWHQCTSSVAGHIQSGGIKWSGRVGDGYEMKDFITKFGFNELNFPKSELDTCSKMTAWTNKYALKGDVCVMTHGADAWSKSIPGHAAMWNGKNWSSDFIQCNALVYSPKETPYNGVKIFRFAKCVADNSGDDSNMPSIPQGKKLELKVIRKCLTDKWSYGQFYINGTYYCDVIECGKQGSSYPQKLDKIATIAPNNYTITLEKSDAFTEHAKNPNDYKLSPEFGEFLKKDILYNNNCLMPRVGGKTINDVSDKGTHSGILIHGGRGSVNSIGGLVLGRKLTKKYVESKIKEDTLYFANPSNNKSENMKIYQKDWNIYMEFYKKLTDVVGGKGKTGQVATLNIIHDFWK